MFRRATVSALQHLKRANFKNPQLLQLHPPALNCQVFVRNESTGTINLDTIWAGSSENSAQNQAVEHLDWSPSMEATAESVIADKTAVEPIAMPELPSTVDVVQLAVNGEPTLASLGLGTWSPAGLVQQGLEILHCNVGLPWWGAIALGTVIMRAAMFPLDLKSQRTAARVHNNSPQVQVFQMKLKEARNAHNMQMAVKYVTQMLAFMRKKEISPFQQMNAPARMALFSASYFFGLRHMVNLPVESMKTGGMLWFTDLTVPDPLFLLPLITSMTVWATVKFVASNGSRSTSSPSLSDKLFMVAIPLSVFPITMHFPAAMLCWWATTSAISLAQHAAFKLPKVRQFFNIDALIVHPPEDLPMIQKKSFMKTDNGPWTGMKLSKEMEERQRYDEELFGSPRRAYTNKTFKYDPTKASGAVQAKKK